MNKFKVVLAAITLVFCTGAAVVESVGVAHASIFNCRAFRNGTTEEATCDSVTAGGNQHVRAWINCGYGVFTRKVFYGPKVAVLGVSRVTCDAGGASPYGGYQTVP